MSVRITTTIPRANLDAPRTEIVIEAFSMKDAVAELEAAGLRLLPGQTGKTMAEVKAEVRAATKDLRDWIEEGS